MIQSMLINISELLLMFLPILENSSQVKCYCLKEVLQIPKLLGSYSTLDISLPCYNHHLMSKLNICYLFYLLNHKL